MTVLSHPSDEQLSAFFDRQVPPAERLRIETHVTECVECREALSEFSSLEAWGPAVEERLPSDLYWQDLPERILARIAAEERTSPGVLAVEPGPSWLRRLLSPGASWGWIGATAAVAMIGGAIYFSQGSGDDSAPIAAAVGPGEVSVPDETLPPGVPPIFTTANPEEEYRMRIATLGMDGNFGTSLDEIRVLQGAAGGSSRIQQVGLASPLGPGQLGGSNVIADPELGYFFNTARRAEEMGHSDVAMQGYHLLYSKADPACVSRLAAETGMVRCAWRAKLAQARTESASVLSALYAEADAAYRDHLAGHHENCRKGWELFVAYVDLANECASHAMIAEAQSRLREIERCLR